MQVAIAQLAALYLSLIARSLRWRLEGEENLQHLLSGPPVVVVLWHEALPSVPVLWYILKRQRMHRPVAALVSMHRDGQLIGRVLHHLGLRMISGSTSRGGAEAMVEMAGALAGGAHIILTPDGPRGPRRVCAPGAARLAAETSTQIIPCGAITSRAITLSSWDRMRLPLPFGRGVIVCGAPISVPRDGWAASLPQITAALTATMDEAAAHL